MSCAIDSAPPGRWWSPNFWSREANARESAIDPAIRTRTSPTAMGRMPPSFFGMPTKRHRLSAAAASRLTLPFAMSAISATRFRRATGESHAMRSNSSVQPDGPGALPRRERRSVSSTSSAELKQALVQTQSWEAQELNDREVWVGRVSTKHRRHLNRDTSAFISADIPHRSSTAGEIGEGVFRNLSRWRCRSVWLMGPDGWVSWGDWVVMCCGSKWWHLTSTFRSW
jgi:hypothetical protein